MKQYLERRTEKKELIGPVIARLRELNYLDDARFALEYARHHAQGRRQGRYRIARGLRSRGVPDAHIDAALTAVFADTDESALVRARLKPASRTFAVPLMKKKSPRSIACYSAPASPPT